jgi:N-acetyltransferase
MSWLIPLVLRGERVTLEPLAHTHHDELICAVRDGELWNLWYTHVPSPEGMRDEIDRRLAQQAAGSMLPFAVRDARSGAAIGMTTYLNVDAANRRVEIGATWYAASAQGSGLNPECKLLLLSHAFDTLNCIAVEFRTHFFNRQSREAIERLGAKLDGILRSHQLVPNGGLRDTCVYSIIASEWPAVRANLEARLLRPCAFYSQPRRLK